MSAKDAQREGHRRRLLEAAGEIREVLRLDLVDYPDRELERRFVAQPAAAAALADATLAELRRRSQALGQTLAAVVPQALADDGLWLGLAHVEDLPTEGKDLRRIAPVWRRVQEAVDPLLRDLAAGHGLGDDDRQPPGYAPPMRFVDRRYLPTLVETVLREVAALRVLAAESSADAEAADKRSAAARWAAAKPKA